MRGRSLELTESMFIDDTEHVINLMHELKELSVTLSIDDFGSGYSSLSYLKQFPVDYLKIDRSFIKDLSSSDKDMGIIAEGDEMTKNLSLLNKKENEQLFWFHHNINKA